ncbi:MAG: hypothetical protein ACO3K6_02245, partial [Ilumatobacteraceae bacterium]
MASPLVVNALELLRRPGSRKDLVVVVPLDDVDLAGEDRLVDASRAARRDRVPGRTLFRTRFRRCARARVNEQEPGDR